MHADAAVAGGGGVKQCNLEVGIFALGQFVVVFYADKDSPIGVNHCNQAVQITLVSPCRNQRRQSLQAVSEIRESVHSRVKRGNYCR